jgi:hypothetical protein
VARARRDQLGPTTTIVGLRSARDAGPQGRVLIVGRAADETRLAKVMVRIKDPRTHLFWHRGTWSADPVRYRARLSADGTWRLRVSVPDGVIRVRARAVDAAGNRDPSPAVRRVKVGLP